MVVQHNLSAMYTANQLNITVIDQSKSMEKLSSGYRINKAADDAAGLSISEKMRWQIRGLNRASMNATDGISLVQTAEGALNEIHADLQRMRELYVQNCNDTNCTSDREAILQEEKQLYDNIIEIANNTTFNGKHILAGDLAPYRNGEACQLQVGALEQQGISIEIPCCSPEPPDRNTYIGLDLFETTVNCSISGSSQSDVNFSLSGLFHWPNDSTAHEAFLNPWGDDYISNPIDLYRNCDVWFKVLDDSIQSVSELRSKLGAIQNRLEHTVLNLDNTSENTQSAESRLRDTDMAKEMVTLSKDNILAQAGQAMLSQTNQTPQGILNLLV